MPTAPPPQMIAADRTLHPAQKGWQDFLSFAEELCSATEFSNWLAPIRAVAVQEEELVLEVPNIFVREYLLTNYKQQLTALFAQRKDGQPAIRFQIRQEKKRPAAPLPCPKQPQLNPFYRFEGFIEGPSNQFARAAALGVATRPRQSYNPLFIHGGVGLGKTHLLHAIGHHVHRHHRLKIECITTEAFINDLVDHLKSKTIERMKRYYRSLDFFLIDDIQFLQNRLNFEEEFVATFESLIHQNKQIVITSDQPPSALRLSKRLIAQMEWGLVAETAMPDLETQVAILQYKAEQQALPLSDEMAFSIAENAFHNVRQLEGALNRLRAYCRMMNVPPSRDIVARMLAATSAKPVTMQQIMRHICSFYNLNSAALRSKSRHKPVLFPRQVAMYLARELIDAPLSKLAAAFGGKKHSTLLHAWKKIARQRQEDDAFRQQLDRLRQEITRH